MRRSERGLLRRVFSSAHVRWSELDWHVVAVAVLLLAWGLAFVHAMALAPGNPDVGGVDFAAHKKKLVVAAPMLLVGLFLRPHWLRSHAGLVYAGCMALLVLVPFVGDERNNARRWINLGSFDLQPSELAKLGTILLLARVLHASRLDRPIEWARALGVAAAPMLLVAAQPDLGTALTLVPVTLGLIYLAGGRLRAVGGIVAVAALVGVTAWSTGLVQAYQRERVETWIDSFDSTELIAARNGPGFHTYHARVAIGNGGFTGRGVGDGVANETGLLPERDSDSIFAVVAEEWGFVGAAGLVLLYGLFVAFLMVSASGLRDRFSRLVVGGVALYFASHLFINVSVNVGLLPMTGLTLPLLSTGGSSLLASFLALGVALGLASHHERSLDRDAFRAF